MKKTILAIALGALLLATLACGGDTDDTDRDGNVRVTMNNRSGDTVCFVYISPTTSGSWEDDWLGAIETVSSGDSRTFDVEPGDYDLRADDCDHNALYEEYGVSIRGNNWTWDIP